MQGSAPVWMLAFTVFATAGVVLVSSQSENQTSKSGLISQVKALEHANATREIPDQSITVSKLHESVAALLDNLTPPGTISAFAGSQVPTGWELCDGRALPVGDLKYRRLYNAISTNWGSSLVSGIPHFALPDLRGRFLRGVDASPTVGESKRDPDRSARTANSPGGNIGNKVGTVQGDQFTKHTHPYKDLRPEANKGTAVDKYTKGQNDTLYELDDNRASGSAGGSETRPVNAAVNYIIKY